MVQFLLSRTRISRWCVISALFAIVSVTPMWAAGRAKQTPTEIKVPDLLLDGGRTVKFERVFSNDRQVTIKKGFWTKAFDFVVGQPDLHFLVRPYSIVSDSRGRIIISDPGAVGVHIFDFGQQKYKFLSRRDKGKDPMLAPQCVAVDDKDNIYVTDSQAGKIFVYEANGKYQRAIGSLKGGEGFFKRPTGIAVDSMHSGSMSPTHCATRFSCWTCREACWPSSARPAPLRASSTIRRSYASTDPT